MTKCGGCGTELNIVFEEREMTKTTNLIDGGEGFHCSRCGSEVSLRDKINKVFLFCEKCNMNVAEIDKLGYSSAECDCVRIVYMEGRGEWFETKKKFVKKKEINNVIEKITGGAIFDFGSSVVEKVMK
jgi:CRISPR/Cas system-associated protein Cas10 (large subunit of type III CRISPR-Cas system)